MRARSNTIRAAKPYGALFTFLLPLMLATDPLGARAASGCKGGKTWHVAAGESIQSTVDAAGPGDRILVAPGIYNESVSISTECLTLKGGWSTAAERWAVVDGTSLRGNGFSVSAAGVTIEGFEIRGGWSHAIRASGAGGRHGIAKRNWIHHTRRGLSIRPDGAGSELGGWEIKANRLEACSGNVITVSRASAGTIKNNDLHASTGVGIHLLRTTGASVRDNRLDGIEPVGIVINVSSGNEVKDNEVANSGLHAIHVVGASDDNLVKDNLLVGSGAEGLLLQRRASSGNLILDNVVLDSGGDGVALISDDPMSPSQGNVFRGNLVSGSATGCDFSWDGVGDGNCWQANSGTQCPAPLPECP